MRRLLCLIGALAVTATAAGASTVSSGLRGVVYSTSGGACLSGANCTAKRPVAGVTLVFAAAGRASVKTVTRGDGSFRVRLAPGTYGVRTMGGVVSRHLAPTRATVTRGSFRSVTFVIAGPRIP